MFGLKLGSFSIHHDAMVMSPGRVPQTRHEKEENDVDTQSANKIKWMHVAFLFYKQNDSIV